MENDSIAYASMLVLTPFDFKALGIKDGYGIHKVVYGLFEDIRSPQEKRSDFPSGILFTEKEGDIRQKKILILSNRKPHLTPQFGKIETKQVPNSFLNYDRYGFEVTINPTRRDSKTKKLIPIKKREEVRRWFFERSCESWGFQSSPETMEVGRMGVQIFEKSGERIVHGFAKLKGTFLVTDREKFQRSFLEGIGRGRAFGFGLLLIAPLGTQQKGGF